MTGVRASLHKHRLLQTSREVARWRQKLVLTLHGRCETNQIWMSRTERLPMTPKPGPLHELVEPLQSFLQTFTQELTEQQFIPAFRDELRRLVAAIDNLQQSEDTLQQIARGVDRLREVFAPAGTRLLEGVKDLETVMRSNATDLRDKSGQVLKDLLSTHDQLEAALRNEAGLLQEQTSASRESLGRTIEEVEGRLQGLTSTIETLCRRMETEAAALVSAPRAVGGSVPATHASAPSVPVTVHLPEELSELLARTEHTVQTELTRQRTELLSALQQSVTNQEERIEKLDRSLEQAISTVGPRVQEELDQALERIRGQMQSLVSSVPRPAETQSDAKKSSVTHVSPDVITGPLAATENRILNELGALRKAQRGDQAAAEKAFKALAHEYEDAVRKQSTRVNEEVRQVSEALATMQRLAEALQKEERASREQVVAMRGAMESIAKTQSEQDQRRAAEAHENVEALRTQAQALTQKAEEDRHILTQLTAAMSRVEQAATTATDRAHSESRMLREKIDASLKDLAERMQRDTASETERIQDTLRKLAQAWQGELAALREDVNRTTGEAQESLAAHLKQLQAQIVDAQKADQAASRDLHAELGRVASSLDDRVGNLQSATESFTQEMQSHVKAVAGEVAKSRASQEQSLAVLKEAIRANYDENAARLKEVIDGGYDAFVKQIGTIPVALDRYSHLIQSLHQSDQLALQAISSDTKNLLGLATEKFDTMLADSAAMKKVYPLLDRKLEKHINELDAVRKAQSKQDKELAELLQSLTHVQEKQQSGSKVVKEDLQSFQRATEARFETTGKSLTEIKDEIKTVQEEDLPTFRREFATLLSTKFDLMENSVRDRQDALRCEIVHRMEQEKRHNSRVYLLLGLLAVLAVSVQISLYFLNHKPLLP